MFARKVAEALRRLDVGCAQRARWLGVCRVERPVDAAEEARRRAMEEARRMPDRLDGFNRV